ncbi:MAG TPA: hypothetical protein VLY63_21095 [Anaerolineae bacterium]|nr:hypothetical protein [Anaerolineae bacterium]
MIAGPMGAEEGILYADADLEEAVRAKLTHDFAGHYNRPDVFQLRLNPTAPQILRRKGWAAIASPPADPGHGEVSADANGRHLAQPEADRPSPAAAKPAT